MKKSLIILLAFYCLAFAQGNNFTKATEETAKAARKEANEKKAAAEEANKKVTGLKEEDKPRNCVSTCAIKWEEEQKNKIAKAEKEYKNRAADAETAAKKAEGAEAVAKEATDKEVAKRDAEEKAAKIKEANSIEVVFVEGGYFTMGCSSEQGSDCNDDEIPAHNVMVNGFYIGKYPVTQRLWEAVMDINPSAFLGPELPVESVSWEEVLLFIDKLNALTGKQYRLLTEAEWEYAARGGIKFKRSKYSGDNNLDIVAWYNANSGQTTHPVGTKQSNELGIYDMNGNVWEWVQDWKGSFDYSSKANPTGPVSGFFRVYRGCSWQDNALYCRVSRRGGNPPDYRGPQLGFRLALPP